MTTPDKTAEVTAIDNEHKDRLEEIILEIRRHTGSMLTEYWNVGKLADEIVKDQNAEAKFGQGALKYVAEKTGHHLSEIYRMHTVFRRYPEEQINKLSTMGVYITHVVDACSIVDDEKRMAALSLWGTDASAEKMNHTDFKVVVKGIAEEKENVKALKAEQEASGAPKKGGGVRTGTGPKGSPVGSVKSAAAQGEKLVDTMKSAVIAIKEFDGTDKKLKTLVNFSEAVAGILADVLSTGTGLAEVVEEFLANNQDSTKLRKAQVERKESYAASLGALSDLVKGFDKTLTSAEKARKAAEEDEAKKARKAAEEDEAKKAKKASGKKTSKEEANEAMIAAMRAKAKRLLAAKK